MHCQDGVIAIEGNLDISTVQRLLPLGCQLIASEGSVSFDFSLVTNVDSAGVALLLAWWRFAKQHAAIVQFKHLPEALSALLAVTNVDKVLTECVC